MRLYPIFFFLIISFSSMAQEDLVTVSRVLKLMGTRFEITVVAQNEDIGYINIDEAIAEIKRIEKIISSWDSNSETSQINKNAGLQPVKVSTELFELIERSKKISKITDGAFDISYASLDRIWRFNGEMKKLPSKEEIDKSISKINYNDIDLDKENSTVFLRKVGMKLGFGAIGKGYAADKTKALLISKGVLGGIINASGDLTTWGTKNTGEKWMVGITNPLDTKKMFSWLPVIESSVATSGSYEKYVVINDEKYSHIIDPRTGYPTKGVKSVTVFAKKAELCDALATAVFIMGRDSGIHMINQLPGVDVVVIDENNEINKSSGIIFDSSK
ncbi:MULTISPECIES: FAD:protein FMN transferase [Croceitalea]|uniref:FAD:protein FMN transferase n=1 Tax=Croceitalea vernalis TaxID=3075599 RepID=A0ABU3BJ86_9FLAO|nr:MULTISPECIES: FAD:protein FMN transferase [unclassified Croceitalea]MDT0540379.1 FAD:protein FMN transferase [Croceitalea sp. P059]MDT0622215.1 FAD:protein FMN transferase [Croceitalea sp. P007]